MNKINIYVLTFFLSLAGVSIYAQTTDHKWLLQADKTIMYFSYNRKRQTSLRNRHHVRSYAR